MYNLHTGHLELNADEINKAIMLDYHPFRKNLSCKFKVLTNKDILWALWTVLVFGYQETRNVAEKQICTTYTLVIWRQGTWLSNTYMYIQPTHWSSEDKERG